MRIQIISANTFSYETVVGYDPEYADIDDPSGAIMRRRWSVITETEEGNRFCFAEEFDNEAAANKLSERVSKLGTINPDLWRESYEVYGSPAWEAAERLRQAEHMFSDRAGYCRDY